VARITRIRSPKVPGTKALSSTFPDTKARGTKPTRLQAQPLVHTLNERELALLRLMAVGYSSAKIATELGTVIDTVKHQIFEIYGKLGVRTRADAIGRARALHLVEPAAEQTKGDRASSREMT
jgi:LuxR family maltose regulon positive regulatory protein